MFNDKTGGNCHLLDEKYNNTETKMAILNEKFSSFEDKIDKLEEAIRVISETNQSISKILAVHDEKLENKKEETNVIFERIKNLEEKGTNEHNKLLNKFEKIDNKFESDIQILRNEVAEVTKIKWMTIGMGILMAIIISFVGSIYSNFDKKPDNNFQGKTYKEAIDK
jgi:chromosome segregation ATPase